MKELKRDLLTTKYTKVFCEDKEEQKYGAPHHFVVKKAYSDMTCGNKNCTFVYCPYENPSNDLCSAYIKKENNDDILADIHFQEGPIKECGVNGVCNEDLINMVLERLECFQNTEFKCRENAIAITKLEEALMWLRKRTIAREQRGVEGTHEV